MNIEYVKAAINRDGDRRSAEAFREIAYLRISHNSANYGYAELAPLTSWGHPTLAQLFATVDSEQPHPLLQRAIVLANQDLVARQAGLSLVCGAEQIENHLLFRLEDEFPDCAVERIKVKLGRELEHETEQLANLLTQYETLKVRIDFNGFFASAAAFLKWWSGVDFASRIEFVEDPVLSDRQWREIEKHAPEVVLAADQMFGKVSAGVVVVKPSWEDTFSLLQRYNKDKVLVVSTHVLGTALDQAQSLAESLKIKAAGWKLLPCGLLSRNSQFVQESGKIFVQSDALGYGVAIDSQDLQWQTI